MKTLTEILLEINNENDIYIKSGIFQKNNKNMEELRLTEINIYYKKALDALFDNDYRKATRVLYYEMPDDLYEQSIDILFDRNIKSDNKEEFNQTKQLIKIVDDKLVNYSHKKENEENLIDFDDQFIGDIF